MQPNFGPAIHLSMNIEIPTQVNDPWVSQTHLKFLRKDEPWLHIFSKTSRLLSHHRLHPAEAVPFALLKTFEYEVKLGGNLSRELSAAHWQKTPHGRARVSLTNWDRAKIFDALQYLPYVRRIDFKKMRLGNEGARALAAMLPVPRSPAS